MTDPIQEGWPKPYLLELYARAVEEGCIRVRLNGNETRFKSLKASWLRLRRRKDPQNSSLMRPEYYLCSILWEADRGAALIIYNQLPDGKELPEIESVADKTPMLIPLPPQVAPPPGPTLEVDPGDFDADRMVQGLLSKITFDEENGNDEPTENLG